MASTTPSSTTTLLAEDAKPPKSRSEPYYSIHPHWQDVKPIPQVDQSGALAAITYSPRYSESMAYLRALMAANEVSERALALTQDLISMNPAHYTVWIYRMRILKGLWSTSKGQPIQIDQTSNPEDQTQETAALGSDHDGINEPLWANIHAELKWLDDVSFRYLKNYQIWHHRHALADLFPLDPASLESPPSTPALSASAYERLSKFITSEQTFLAEILSLDIKNYHVWSYRQWLCTRFATFLLPSDSQHTGSSIAPIYRSHPETSAIDLMINDDLRNNSAWSHRYFLLFGYHELRYAQSQTPPIILKQVNEQKILHKAGLVDTELVQAEILYTKKEIRKAPQNASTWNYLRGLLGHGDINITSLRSFCEEFIGPNEDLWMDQWVEVEIEDAKTHEKKTEKQPLGVQSSHAVEWLSEIYGQDGAEEARQKSKECLRALGEKWDPIRKAYWDFRVRELEEDWANQQQTT